MKPRISLPDRREQEMFDVDFEGVRARVSIGFDAEGRAREIFVSADHEGSTMDAVLNDSSILVSNLLQLDVTATQLRRSMSRLGGGLGAATAPTSPVGAVIDLVAEVEAEMSAARQTT